MWLLSLPDGRKDAELLEQAQVVIGVPMLDDLAAREAEDFDARDLHALPGWGETQKYPLMGATLGEAGHHLVSFGDQVLNHEADIRESRQEHASKLSGPFDPTRRTDRGRMIDRLRVDELIKGSRVLAVDILETPFCSVNQLITTIRTQTTVASGRAP